jgi:uncharacterized protein
MRAELARAVTTADGLRSRARSIVAAATAGALVGAGLLLSGMTQPAKVIGFLDVTRGWDPSLGFVMAGAITVYAIAFRLMRSRRKAPWFDKVFHLPARRDIDLGLIFGAAIFGIGWGLGGLCPGPALVAAAAGSSTGLLFVAAMLVGMLAQHGASRR